MLIIPSCVNTLKIVSDFKEEIVYLVTLPLPANDKIRRQTRWTINTVSPFRLARKDFTGGLILMIKKIKLHMSCSLKQLNHIV
jgi:hypothetical protein